jgi:hypothetical protein
MGMENHPQKIQKIYCFFGVIREGYFPARDFFEVIGEEFDEPFGS